MYRTATFAAVAAAVAAESALDFAAVHAKRAATPQVGAPDVDSFTFLRNDQIIVGIDTSRGGTIGWLGPASQPQFSLLNIHDFGRVVQGSFYSGPSYYNPDNLCNSSSGWGQEWPWNPIGAGDVYNTPANILDLVVAPDGMSATVTTLPMQWACDDVPCECTFQQNIRLNGSAVEIELTLANARSDTTFYGGRTQELPAVYVRGDHCALWAYTGSDPWTGGAMTQVNATWPWSTFYPGERWMAYTNASGYGVGVVSPFVAQFGAGRFFGNAPSCAGGPYDAETGYIAPWASEVLDAAIQYTYKFALVLGSLNDIRSYAYAQHGAGWDESDVPDYNFAQRRDRAHCVYTTLQDTGYPIPADGLHLTVTADGGSVVGPFTSWQPSAVPTMYVNASYPAGAGAVTAAVAWQVFGTGEPCADCVLPFSVTADGAFHVYAVPLSTQATYTSAPAILRTVFIPYGGSGMVNKTLTLASITATPPA